MEKLENQVIKNFALKLLSGYWGHHTNLIENLPISQGQQHQIVLPVQLSPVNLPDWAKHCGIDGHILVPAEVVIENDSWQDVDWWYVIYWFSNCLAEREFEKQHGPIHSYSFKLSGWDGRMWEHAWVNRIAMFLHCWANFSYQNKVLDTSPKPLPAVLVTHDLDAVTKTKSIRFKQTAFHTFNAFRALKRVDIFTFLIKLAKAISFFFKSESYFHLHKLNNGTDSPLIKRKIINIYGGDLGNQRSFKEVLIDPSYDVNNQELINGLIALESDGYEFGLHQSFKAWNNYKQMKEQRAKVSKALNRPIETCRQHWLRFSFGETWLEQYKAGFREDTTLGFNDRLGFRNGLALTMNLRLLDKRFKSDFKVVPMVMMDSHLYDYSDMTELERKEKITRIVDEVTSVGGTVSVIWHSHTLGNDYGWESGYKTLLQVLREYA